MMPNLAPLKCASLQMRIAPERIHFMKSILEGYDGLAMLTTIDRHDGIVELRFSPERKDDLTPLLAALHPLLMVE